MDAPVETSVTIATNNNLIGSIKIDVFVAVLIFSIPLE
jgi:hypothetical protein